METYNRVDWKDYPETDTPVSAENLNKMDKGIDDLFQFMGNKELTLGDKTVTGELQEIVKILDTMILDKIYPVGSVCFTTKNENPSATLGGTWVAYGASDTYLRLGGAGSGGANSVSIGVANLPSHTHSQQGTFTTGGQSQGHTHSGTTGDAGNHNHDGTTASAGRHYHTYEKFSYDSGRGGVVAGTGYALYNREAKTEYEEDHTHLFSTKYAGTHKHSFTTGGVSADHTHAVSLSGNTGATGSGAALSVAPKYVQAYAWKRTA